MTKKFKSDDFTFHMFTERNSSYKLTSPSATNAHRAQMIARELSLAGGFFKVQVESAEGFETYEKGELTEWSHPYGLGLLTSLKS